MNGPDHYATAEQLISEAERARHAGYDPTVGDAATALAQVHATLALAAATIEPWTHNVLDYNAAEVARAWTAVTE